jgi:hypothetical protein
MPDDPYQYPIPLHDPVIRSREPRGPRIAPSHDLAARLTALEQAVQHLQEQLTRIWDRLASLP